MKKKMTLHMNVENHTDLLMLTDGFFSFTQDGMVVTNPKLKRTLPSTPACEFQEFPVATASSVHSPSSLAKK